MNISITEPQDSDQDRDWYWDKTKRDRDQPSGPEMTGTSPDPGTSVPKMRPSLPI